MPSESTVPQPQALDAARSSSKEMFERMIRIRYVEEKIAEMYPQQEMRCPVHLSVGQEATAVGVCAALRRDDFVLSAHRSHAHYLAKGGDLKSMLAELYGRATGCCGGKGGSMHLIDRRAGFLGAVPIVGSTIPIATGVAFATQMRNEPQVTAVFFGDGAVEEGVFHESINFAALKRLPIVFVCENNGFSVYSPLDVRQPKNRELYELAAGHGIDARQGFGNDVDQVHEMARRAVQRARQGDGPAFLEFKTYRWREHCGPYYDDHLGYRSATEFEEWKGRCPIDQLQRKLLSEGTLTQAEIDRLNQIIAAEVEDAFLFAKSSPFPEPDALYTDVYAS